MNTDIPHLIIFINGIKANPGDDTGWTDRAVTHVNARFINLPIKGEKYEYATTAIGRRWNQAQRATGIAKMIGFYTRANPNTKVTLVGHSNGCDIIARVLDQVTTKVHSIHLFAPAADEVDFRRALRDHQVDQIHIYGSSKDAALKGARVSRALFGWLGWGYGSLGLNAAPLVTFAPDRVFDHSNNTFGHSTWFDKDTHFDATMDLFVRNEFETA